MPRKTKQQEMEEREALENKIKEHKKAVNDPLRRSDKSTLKLFAYDMFRNFLSTQSEEDYPERELAVFPGEAEKRLEAFKKYEQQNKDFKISDIPGHMDKKQLDEIYLEILDLINVYAGISYTGENFAGVRGPEAAYFRDGEGNLASLIYKKIKLLSDYLMKPSSGEEVSVNDYGEVIGILPFFGGLLNGCLGDDPSRPENPDDPHVTYTGTYMGVDKIRKLQLYDQSGKFKPEREIEINLMDQPLFPHTPTSHDINQSAIGDCYFLSSLASIADTQPEKIREMMKDNGDGTVTVRFYYKDSGITMPLYVTVDKVASEGQAEGALWVSMMEKAFAASGLMSAHKIKERFFKNIQEVEGARPVPANINEIYRKNKDKSVEKFRVAVPAGLYPWLYDKEGNPKEWIPDLDMISGGTAEQAFEFLLGNSSNIVKHTLNDTDISPQSDAQITDIDIQTLYTERELDAYRMIKKACEGRQNAVTAGTFSAPKGDDVTIVGINKKHEYTVLSAEEHEIDGVKRCFIKLRNPHGNVGRTYIRVGDKLKAVVNSEVRDSKNILGRGFCYVELTDFMKEFSEVTVASLTDSVQAKNKRFKDNEIITLAYYKQALLAIKRSLDISKQKKSVTKDSREYKAMKKVLDDILRDFPKDTAALRTKLAKLKTKVIAFNEHTVRIVKGKKNIRRNVKIHASEALLKIISGTENNRLYRPKALLKNEAADSLINEFLEKGDKLIADKEAYTSMREAVLKDRAAAKKRLMKSGKFLKWVAKYPTYMKLFDAVKAGVSLKDFAPEEAFADQKNYTVATIDSLRRNMRNRLGSKFKAEEKEYLDKKKADEEAELAKKKTEDSKESEEQKEKNRPSGKDEIKFL